MAEEQAQAIIDVTGESYPLFTPTVADVTTDINPIPGLSPRAIDQRADRYAFSVNRSFDEIRSLLNKGQEDSLRTQTAAEFRERSNRQFMEALSQVSQKKGSPLNDSEVNQLYSAYQRNKDFENPKSVFEYAQASKWFDNFTQTAAQPKDGWYQEYFNKFPTEETQLVGIGKHFATITSALMKKREELKSSYDKQPWGFSLSKLNPLLMNSALWENSWLGEQMRSVASFGLYEGYKTRGLVPDTSFFQGLRGTNLEEQGKQLFRLPTPQALDFINNIDKHFPKDPGMALQYVDSLLGQGDKDFEDLSDLLTLSTAPGVGLVSKGLFRGAAKIAIKSTVGSITADAPAEVAMQSGVGNLEKAAVAHVTNKVVEEMAGRGDPARNTMERLTSNLRLWQSKITNNVPANFRELAVRLQEGIESTINNFVQYLDSAQKVERIPAAVRIREGIEKIKDEWARTRYPGLDNHILDISDPWWDRKTNTYYVDIVFGSKDGLHFERPEVAASFAREQGITLKGFTNTAESMSLQEQISKLQAQVLKNKQTGKFIERPGFRTEAGEVYKLEKSGQVTKKGSGTEATTTFDKTVYVNRMYANAVTGLKGAYRFIDHGDGTLSVMQQQGKNWVMTAVKVPYSESNFMNRIPIGLSHPTSEGVYSVFNVGSPVKEMGTATDFIITDLRNKIAELNQSNKINPVGAIIQNDGFGWRISHAMPLDETAPSVRSVLMLDENAKTPTKGFIRNAASILRSPDETLSKDSVMASKVATYAPNRLLQMLKAELKELDKAAKFTFPGSSKRERWLDLERTLKHGQHMDNPNTGEKGYLFDTVAELNDHYIGAFNRPPSDVEVKAYFTFKKYAELEGMFRDLRRHTNDLRLGAETHTINFTDSQGTKHTSNGFAAKKLTEFPPADHEGENIAVLFNGKVEVRPWSQISDKLRKWVVQAVKEGKTKGIELIHPEDRPLSGFAGISDSQRIRYVVSNSMESKPLQIERSAARPWETDYTHYIKQPIIEKDPSTGKWIYRGDRTIVGLNNGAQAAKLAKIFNEVRLLIAAGKEAEAAVKARTLGLDWTEHSSWYESGRLSSQYPIQVVDSKSFTLRDTTELLNTLKTREGNKFRGLLDETRMPYYRAERDPYEIYSVNQKGTRNNPLWSFERPEYIDPIPTMHRAVKKIVNSTFMDDYKFYAVEHWLQEAKTLNMLRATHEEIASNPMGVFYHTPLTEGAALTSDGLRLSTNRMKIKGILGEPSSTDKFLYSLEHAIADSIYRGFGPKTVGSWFEPSWLVHTVPDAGRLLRWATYHSTIGIFALPQFLVQSMTFSNVFAIAPRFATQGTAATFLSGLTRLPVRNRDAWLSRLDQLSEKFGYKPGQWREASEALENSGFRIVGGEHGFFDYQFSPKIVQSAGHDLLEAGTYFFKQAEKNVRTAAYHTAYLEWRSKFPNAVFDNYAKAQVLDRADLMAGNMSSASKSMLQRGGLSFPTQFLSYNLRMAEQMTGKRLTKMEKARMLTLNWGLFGASALGLFGYPFGDVTRRIASDYGYDPEAGGWMSLAMEGLPSAAIKLITGETYAVGTRLGNAGLDVIRDIYNGDGLSLKILLGATHNTLSNMLTHMDGWRQMLTGYLLHDRNDPEFHQPTLDSLIDPIKVPSSGFSAWRLWKALNSGAWLSRKGQLLKEDVSPLSAVLMTVTGVQPQDTADLRNMNISEKTKEQALKEASDEFMRLYNMHLQAMREDDTEGANTHFSNAVASLIRNGYPNDEYDKLMARAIEGIKTLPEIAKYTYWMRKVKPEEEEFNRQMYNKWQELRGR